MGFNGTSIDVKVSWPTYEETTEFNVFMRNMWWLLWENTYWWVEHYHISNNIVFSFVPLIRQGKFSNEDVAVDNLKFRAVSHYPIYNFMEQFPI